jgi:hypothetical protein
VHGVSAWLQHTMLGSWEAGKEEDAQRWRETSAPLSCECEHGKERGQRRMDG